MGDDAEDPWGFLAKRPSARADGMPDASGLYRKVAGTSCGGQMPIGRPPLSATELQTIADWITAGAMND